MQIPPFNTKDLNLFLERAVEREFVKDARLVQEVGAAQKSRGVVAALEGEIEVEGEQVTVQVGFQESFPLSVPFVFLVPWDALGFIPHVEVDGNVCFVRSEGLLVDRRNPIGILEEALDRAAGTLAQGIKGDHQREFADEFEAYWQRIEGGQWIQGFVTPDGEAKKIIVGESDKKRKGQNKSVYTLVADNEATLRAYWNDEGTKPQTYRNALYVPLEGDKFLIPPRPNTFWTLDDVQRVIREHTSTRTRRHLEKLTRKWKHDEVVVFGLLRPSGGRALFAIRFVGVENRHPLFKGARVKQLIPLALRRRDKEYLLPRGGASRALQSQHVVLIGCGSVGGFLALELARAGIGKLTLIDHERLGPENSFRHILGRHAYGDYKATALKAEIEQKLPYLQVKAITERVEKALIDATFIPTNYDLVVVALGIPALSLHLNEVLHAGPKAPPAVHTWVDAYGIGGHALLSTGGATPGCLECLFTPAPDDEQGLLFNRASFAASGQSFAKDLSGCGNLFTPYGSLDAVRTAVLAARLAVRALTDAPTGNPIWSWKGSSSAFRNAGFRLSDRYAQTEDELSAQSTAYHNPNCPVCASVQNPAHEFASEAVIP